MFRKALNSDFGGCLGRCRHGPSTGEPWAGSGLVEPHPVHQVANRNWLHFIQVRVSLPALLFLAGPRTVQVVLAGDYLLVVSSLR